MIKRAEGSVPRSSRELKPEIPPPYSNLVEIIKLAKKESLLRVCHQCMGTGFDSDQKTALCCSCYGMGKIFNLTTGNRNSDYKLQRFLVIQLRGMLDEIGKDELIRSFNDILNDLIRQYKVKHMNEEGQVAYTFC